MCEEKFSVFDQNFVQNKGPPKRNLGFKIRGQTEKNLGIAQTRYVMVVDMLRTTWKKKNNNMAMCMRMQTSEHL